MDSLSCEERHSSIESGPGFQIVRLPPSSISVSQSCRGHFCMLETAMVTPASVPMSEVDCVRSALSRLRRVGSGWQIASSALNVELSCIWLQMPTYPKGFSLYGRPFRIFSHRLGFLIRDLKKWGFGRRVNFASGRKMSTSRVLRESSSSRS
jgi:hypothetical protein